jgi:hypothetical protein
MTFLISSCWRLNEKSEPNGWGDALACFALKENVDRVILMNVLDRLTEPWRVFGGEAFRAELDEHSPLTRNANRYGLTWVLGANDRVLGKPEFRAVKGRLENRGVTFIDNRAAILDRDGAGNPKFVALSIDGDSGWSVYKTRQTPLSWLRLRPPLTCQNDPLTEDVVHNLAWKMAQNQTVAVVHDLPRRASWARLGPHAGYGVWVGCAGRPGDCLLVDPDEPGRARVLSL